MGIIWASTRENLSSGFANNKGADQPGHPPSQISTFVFRLFESTISKVITSEISIFQLVSVAEETGLSLALSQTPEDMFFCNEAHLLMTKEAEKKCQNRWVL